MNETRPITMNLTVQEAMILQASLYNAQLAGKLTTPTGMTPSKTAELAVDLFGRIKWLLDDSFDEAQAERYTP